MFVSEAASSKRPNLLWLLSVLLSTEMTVASLVPHPWFHIEYFYRGLPIFFGLTLLFFGRAELLHIRLTTFRVSNAAIHVGSLALLSIAQIYLITGHQQLTTRAFASVRDLWLILGLSVVPTLLLTFVSVRKLVAIARRLGVAWLYTATSAFVLLVLRDLLSRSWASSTFLGYYLRITAFHGAKYFLKLLYPTVVSDASIQLLGTTRFQVLIGSACSGVQGLALLIVLMTAWFFYARRYLRPARVLVLGCLAMLVLWTLNIVRLVALIAIGTSGYPKIAMNGFHSEAGWIALTLVSLGCLMMTERIAWFRKPSPMVARECSTTTFELNRQALRNVPAIYLSPFLAITGASVLSQAVSGGFEWLYPIRLLAPLAMFWLYRKEYRRSSFRFSPKSVCAGFAVAALWVGAHRLQTDLAPNHVILEDLGSQLASLSQEQRIFWVSCRAFAAVVTVPVAEELAFRGFLARRLMSNDVESVPYANLSTFAIVASSVCFGLMHGWMWAPGIASGVVFGLLAKRRNRIGDAIVAHATANLAIAAWVLLQNDYSLW